MLINQLQQNFKRNIFVKKNEKSNYDDNSQITLPGNLQCKLKKVSYLP